MDKGYKIDINRLRDMLNGDPTKKRKVQERLEITRHTMSNLLKGKRHLYAGELLVIADVLGVPPRELAA
jgi:plasmid maintenance system antidote protein VapI